MIFVPTEMWENHSQKLPTPPPPLVKKIITSRDHKYNKWTKVRLHHDPFLKSEKQKWESIQIPIVQTGLHNQGLKQNRNVYV